MRMLLLDLDETLYPRGNGVLDRIDGRINDYLRRRVGIAAGEVDAVRHRLRDAHGTTMRGLELHYGVDVDDYLATVHRVDLSDLLGPAPAVRALLERLPGRKAVFTNAPRHHAEQVLRLLALADAFEAVLSLEDLGLLPKPDLRAYTAVTTCLGVDAADCLFVDDTHANALGASRAGMRAVWLAPEPQADPEIHHVITALDELEDVVRCAQARGKSANAHAPGTG